MVVISMDELPSSTRQIAIWTRGFTLFEGRIKRVEVLLKSLNPHDRAAVVMYYWFDFSYGEIANSLSLTESAVKSRLHRARLTLAQKWQEQGVSNFSAERKTYESPAF
jgi:RNA polymerase sigma factor (sigma-70 family)